MKEYIEREAAVKEYCLDMCGHEYEADLCGKCNYPLRNVPSADVRPVVFCRECRRAEQDDSGAVYCTVWDRWEMPWKGFCHLGSRKVETKN